MNIVLISFECEYLGNYYIDKLHILKMYNMEGMMSQIFDKHFCFMKCRKFDYKKNISRFFIIKYKLNVNQKSEKLLPPYVWHV